MQKYSLLFCFLVLARIAAGQMVAVGNPLPKTTNPPVVFLNGYQQSCSGSTFSTTFGVADQVLATQGLTSVYFDNCTVANKPSIEQLGQAFGQFLANLRYTDGSTVGTVDVIAHSMGGLIVRSYLSGKQTAPSTFQPPAVIAIRKAIFLATPHFGASIATLFSGLDAQVTELASGSRFVFDLGTWNQGTDDLRGVDALALEGNGGTGIAIAPGFDDGVVALTSASIAFAEPGRSRILPYCHTDGGGLIGFTGYCLPDAPGIAKLTSATQDVSRAVLSFLAGTTDWQSIGTAPEQNKFLSTGGGIVAAGHAADDSELSLSSVNASGGGTSKTLNPAGTFDAYTDLFPAGPVTLTVKPSNAASFSYVFTLNPAVYAAVTAKPGPRIDRVFPSASATFPLAVAPGELVSIYGQQLAAATASASMLPLPQQLSDAQVLFGGAASPLLYASALQVNAQIPDSTPTGLMQLTIQNGAGKRTVNVLVQNAVPALFTLDGSGTGAAAALRASNGSVVGTNNPLTAGTYVELFATGLGSTTAQNGLQVATATPTVTVGGMNCAVTFAGRAPGFVGLDQINCLLPTGLTTNSATPVVITAGGRTSNTATLAIQ